VKIRIQIAGARGFRRCPCDDRLSADGERRKQSRESGHNATDVPATARDALAQLQPTDGIHRQHSDTAGREVKLQNQRKPPRKRAVPREFLMARQAQFGWFGYNNWRR
jgi:hypothetical protein